MRESERKPGNYSLDFFGITGLSHFRITAICGDYYIGGRKFSSLQALIGYYTTLGSLMKNEKLEHPVPPPEPVHIAYRVRAQLPYDGTPDSDELRYFFKLSFKTMHSKQNNLLFLQSLFAIYQQMF